MLVSCTQYIETINQHASRSCKGFNVFRYKDKIMKDKYLGHNNEQGKELFSSKLALNIIFTAEYLELFQGM